MTGLVKHADWRLGRKFYCWARGDLANNSGSNGEYWMLDAFIRSSVQPVVLIDAGANVGDWTRTAVSLARANDKPARTIYAFEPSTPTREILKRNLGDCDDVRIVPTALSSHPGVANFYYDAAGAGTNSLSPASGSKSEQVEVSTLDAFVSRQNISDLGMVKIDTEGFDFAVLEGFKTSLSNGLAEVVQFEYNWRWLLNKASLRDVFNLIEGMPYVFGKLERRSIVFHDAWHFELDRFIENNYVLIRKDSPLLHMGTSVRFDSFNVETKTKSHR